MEASIRFEVARHIGHDLMLSGESETSALKPDPCRAVRLHHISINSLVNPSDAWSEFGRMKASLPLRRRIAPIRSVKAQQTDSVSRAKSECVLWLPGELWIKSEIDIGEVIIELKIG